MLFKTGLILVISGTIVRIMSESEVYELNGETWTAYKSSVKRYLRAGVYCALVDHALTNGPRDCDFGSA
ncbi:MAG: hypothetical protein N3G20_08260 [Verrucomicrobiae bacterium]|nr:hypothetical protein [Verrucomicrobiae bacterium]